MKKFYLLLILLVSTGGIMAQSAEDKAKAKAEAAQLKAAQKEAKKQLQEAIKIKEQIALKIADKTADEDYLMEESRRGISLLQPALESGMLNEKSLGEAYNTSVELCVQPHNIQLMRAADKKPIDTLFFYNNLKMLTDGLANTVKYTKIPRGDKDMEKDINNKRTMLSSCADYYIYAGQFEAACKRYDNALEAYDMAMNYDQHYPETEGKTKTRIENSQIAYYAFHTAHNAKMYDKMDKYYDLAMQFEQGAKGTQQAKISSYLEMGDSAQWASAVKALTLDNPQENEDYVQILLSYYQKQGLDKMLAYADEVLAKDPNLLIANYGKGYAYFAQEKYDEALECYIKCTEIKSDYYDAWYQAGLCKFRQALGLNATISSIKNQQKAKATLEDTKKLFSQAIPYFEKARECTPNEPEKWAYELKQCYSVTGQAAKAAEMDKLL